MNTFLTLSDFYHFRDDKRVIFKEEIVDNEKFTIVFYQIADNEYWQIPYAKETRGHTFDVNGNLVSATFDKFFNLNENGFTLQDNLDFTNARFFDKVDGSMLSSIVINGKVFLKTKKSFYSEVSVRANQNIKQNEKELVLALDKLKYTTIFEYTEPENTVVVDYGKEPKFTLLAARSRITGEYLDYETLVKYAKMFGVNVVREYPLTLDKALSEINNVTGREGYVINLQSGLRVKLKFDWYRLHHRVKTCLRERDVAEMVVDELIDDIKSTVILSGEDINLINEIENRVVNELNTIRTYVESIAEKEKDLHIKDIVFKYKDDRFSWLIIQACRKQNVNYIKYWKTYYLKQYSLVNVYNKNF